MILIRVADSAVHTALTPHKTAACIRGVRWTSSRPSHAWQNRSTAFDPHLTHAYTPTHAEMQRLVLSHALPPLVDRETLIAQRQYIDDLHARQLRHECSMTGTLPS